MADRIDDLIRELRAKSWQSTRRGKLQQDHVCWRAAEEIVELLKVKDAPAAERGWRSFWDAFKDHLNFDCEQRTYSWHSIADAAAKGMAAVKRDIIP